MTALSDLLAALDPLPPNGRVYVSGCGAEIQGLSEALRHLQSAGEFELSGIFVPGVNRCDYSAANPNCRVRTFFMTPQLAKAGDRVNYSPWRYREIARYYADHIMDLAVVMLSPPDQHGYCSYGVSADYAPLTLPQARCRIGVINQQMPRVNGASIHISELHQTFDIDQPLVTARSVKVDESSQQIARLVAPLVHDGATIQMGLGTIPGAIAMELVDRRNLRIQSGLIEDSVFVLEDAGALDADYPILAGVALGPSDFYQRLNDNSRFDFQAVTRTHDIESIAKTDDFVAINGALEVDLLGQVNSSVLPNGYISGMGGLPEFVQGVHQSKRGRSVIVLNAATTGADAASRIVAAVRGNDPSLDASMADIVATEFGMVSLRDKSGGQRIEAMISIADPRFRESLRDAAKAL